MSRNHEGLPNDEASAISYVQKLINQGWVVAAYLIGSRSPKTRREPRLGSDWDFVFVSARENQVPVLPRDLGILNACVDIINEGGLEEFLTHNRGATCIYPEEGMESEVLPPFKAPKHEA